MDSIIMKRILKRFLIIISSLIIIGLIISLYAKPNYYKESPGVNIDKLKNYEQNKSITANTVRLFPKIDDPIKMATVISQTVYPATFKDNKPGAVILANKDKISEVALSVGLIHHPIDAPILYVYKDRLPQLTKKELKRLDPEGVMQDGNVQVYLVGDIEDKVKRKVEALGFKTRVFKANDPFSLAEIIDQYKSIMHADHTDQVIIAEINHPEYYISALPWIAHAGDGLLFIDGNKIPDATKKALAKRPQDAFIYLMGPSDIISENVAKKLVRYGHVQRIPGKDPFQLAKAFAGYKDVGRNFGWWIRKSTRSFGWGIAEAGHNFIFANYKDWPFIILASILSHKGKHGPLLLVKKAELPNSVEKYLETVQPSYTGSQEQLFNFGWIIGAEDKISKQVNIKIDQLLEVKGVN